MDYTIILKVQESGDNIKMNQKYAFLWALIITLIVFNIGIFFGYQLEKSRINKINELYTETDLYLLDQRIQSDAFDTVNLNCNSSLEENIKFADKIYEDTDKYKNMRMQTKSQAL